MIMQSLCVLFVLVEKHVTHPKCHNHAFLMLKCVLIRSDDGSGARVGLARIHV